jgi:hypothetical protein
MKKIFILLCLLLAACATDTLNQSNSADPTPVSASNRLLYKYEYSEMCRGCHTEIYEQYKDSMHANSFSNPIFNAQYFKEVVPRALKDSKFLADARKCLMCHSPVVYMNYSGLVSTPQQAANYESGVTCDFCHTLSGYADNGDYLQNPSGKKQGPLQNTTHHAEYSGFLQVGDYCGRCHNATSHNGLEVKSTFYEWQESSFGKRNLVCQECHMNKFGILKNGIAEFQSGVAAHLNIGSISVDQKKHDKLYTHAFPGAHSVSQLEDALNIEFRVGSRSADDKGRFAFGIFVNNERSGHKMPSGSSDLRFMWLSVTAKAEDGTQFPVTLLPKIRRGAVDYSVAGASPDDSEVLGNDVPLGSRLYRSVFVDAKGHQSLFHYDAVKNVFDNRLNAGEIRSEAFEIKLPKGFAGHITLSASLSYLAAPSSYAKHLDVPDFKPVTVASHKKIISLVANSATPRK